MAVLVRLKVVVLCINLIKLVVLKKGSYFDKATHFDEEGGLEAETLALSVFAELDNDLC